MAAPRDRVMPARATSQPVIPRSLRRPALQLIRQMSLDSPLSPGPDYVPDCVSIETNDSGGKTVSWRVYVTEVNGTRTLDLYCSWTPDTHKNRPPLTELPLEVCDLIRLERLWASHNLLSSLPPTLSHLTHLRELLLHQNKFSEFPSVVCRLPNLELLWLSSNQISAIPSEISHLTLLRRLHLDRNHITELPDSVCNLTQLEVLYLNHNSVQRVSESIGRLVSLRHLLLHHNEITELPRNVCELVAIERLDLRYNHLKHLQTEFRLFQTEKNYGGGKRVLTSNNPFDQPLSRMKSADQGSPILRPRTMSFPLSGHIRRKSDSLRSLSPSPTHLPTKRHTFSHSQSEEK